MEPTARTLVDGKYAFTLTSKPKPPFPYHHLVVIPTHPRRFAKPRTAFAEKT